MRSEKDYLYAIASSTALNKCLSSPAVSQLPEKTLALIKQSAENSSLLLTEVRIIHLTPQLSSPGYFHSKTSTEIIASSTQDSSVMLSISQPARSIDVLPYPILYNTLWYLVGNSRAYQVCEYGLVKRTFYHCLRDLVSRRITLSANSRFQSRIAGYHLYSLIGHVYPSVKTLVFVVPEKVNIELIRIFAGTMKTITSLTLDFALIEDDVSYTCAVIDLFYTYCKLVTRFKLAETGRIPADEVTGEIKIGLEKLESLTLVNYRFRNDHLFSDSYFNKLTVFSFSEENSERISTSLKRGLMRFAAECPNLKSLTLHMELVYLDHEIVQGFVMNSPLIESLELSEIEISMQLLTRICRLARLSKLDIAIPGLNLSPSIIDIISSTRKLTQLAITQDHSDLLDYKFLFEKIGSRLESLVIYNADQDLIELIPFKCPNLKSLQLPWLIDPEEVLASEEELVEYRARFKKMHTLRLDIL